MPASRPVSGRPPRSLTRLAAGVAVLVVLAGYTSGLPALLWHVGGNPIPASISLDATLHALTRPDDGTLLLRVLVVAGWLVWATFCLSLLSELAGRLAGRRLPLPPGLRTQRRLAGALVGTLAAIAVPAAANIGHTPAAPVAAAVDPEEGHPATSRDTPSQPELVRHLVERGEALLDLQERYGVPWQRIAQANYGVVQPDGRSLQPGQTRIHPGWQMRIPATGQPPTSATVPVADHQGDDLADTPENGPVQAHVVANGDWMWHVADRYLGDPERYPDIAALNPELDGRYRHFPDHVQPGDQLTLPADAHDTGPRRHATGQPVPVGDPPTPQPLPQPEPAAPPLTAEPNPAPPASPSATASGGDQQEPRPVEGQEHPDDGGVTLPGGSFVPWTLAAAITAAGVWVWLQRRRGPPAPGTEDGREQTPELPPPVAELQRQVARHPDVALPVDLAERAAAVPDLPPLPAGGVGLVGDGAHPAARAALVATLATGGPRDPDRRGEVVIDGATLTTLIGADAARLGPWPRLHIADDLDHALTIVEARLLHRSRILDEHSLTDLDTLRERTPDEEPLPPVLLVAETPPHGARMRARVSLGLGTGLDVSALLLGAWDHGTTLQVTTDGCTSLLSGPPVDTTGERMAVLDTATAIQFLVTLREAHTGEPPNVPASTPESAQGRHDPLVAVPNEEPEPDPTRDAATADREGQPKIRLRVLGSPRVEDIRLPGRPPRAKALELAVYLACHPGGAPTRELGEYLNPDARVREADQRVHTNASNLRHVLGRAGGPRKNAYLVKTGGRYRLDPATVEVDLWRLRELLHQATAATARDDRRELALQACQLYAAPLAKGCDYEWVEPYREKVRRWGTQAHLLAAGELLEADPQHAADLLDKAISLDSYNEELYRTAMHARHALGDGEGIRTLLRALNKALGDLDAEPNEETIDLAGKLRASLDLR